MNIDFKITAAQTAFNNAEKAALAGLSSCVAQYKSAAKYYREAAKLAPNRADELNKLADECDNKANNFGVKGKNPSNGSNIPISNTPNVNDSKKVAQGQAQTPQPNQDVEQLTVEEALARLNALTGLQGVKKKVTEWVSLVKSFKEREEAGLPVPDGFSYHLVFTGNPGTGKTTVARLMAQIYRSLGILQVGQLVETARNDLVAGYVGQTAIKTQEAINKALGGVLFVDEAYDLAKGGGNDFGQEAINTILKGMEDHRKELVIIMAGYSGPMAELLKTNEGLTSRFSNVVEFEDYTADELYQIFKGLCDKNSYVLNNSTNELVKEEFEKLYQKRDEHFGNARTVRNIFQKTVEKQAMRIQKLDYRTKDDMMRMIDEDLPDFSKVR